MAEVPSDGLRFHAALSEGQGRSVAITVDSKSRTVALAADAAGSPGEVAAKAFTAQDKTPLEIEQLASQSRLASIIAKPAAKRSKAESDELFNLWLRREDRPFQDLAARLAESEKEQLAIRARGTVAHVMQERAEPPKAYVLFRGEYDKRREEVKPATPAFLPPMPAELPRNRLGFAQWLLRPEHPLTARVTVNRFWQEVFGTGLVKTSRGFRRQRRDAGQSRSCWIGWRSISASRAGT